MKLTKFSFQRLTKKVVENQKTLNRLQKGTTKE